MATTPTTRVTTLARTHRLDIDTATYPASQYQQAMGIEDLKLVEEPRVEDDEDYDDTGAMRETNTGYSWRLEGKVAYSTNLAGSALDPVHAFLRTQFKKHRTGRVERAEFGVRFYHRDGLDSGHEHEGRVYVKTWTLPGGKGRNAIDVVLQGQGDLADIANPAGSLLPVVSGVTPVTGGIAGGGAPIQIFGRSFTTVVGAAGVKFGATNATSYTVVNDSLIVAVVPAHAAGLVQVIVTNPTGPSVDTTADDYTYV